MNKSGMIDMGLFESLLFALDENLQSDSENGEQQGGMGQMPGGQSPKPDNLLLNQLKKFMDEMPGGFFIYRADGNEEILYANTAMVRIFGCSTMQEFRELTGNSFRGIVHPDDLDEVEQSIIQQITGSKYKLDHVEYRIVQKDGTVYWVDDYGHFVHSKSLGDIFYVFIGDATERNEREMEAKNTIIRENRRREQYLQKQIDDYSQELRIVNQEQLRRLELIEGLSIDYESIFYVDLDGNWMKAYRIGRRFKQKFSQNGQVCTFEGFDSDYINKWVHPDDRGLLYGVANPDYIRKRLCENKTFHINYRICQDGKTAYIQLRVVNVSTGGRISQVVMGYRDVDSEIIQEMKQRQMLTEALNEANMANKAKTLFLSNMSHDIRTPMNAIVGFTSLIKRNLEDKAKISGYLDMISASSDQLLQLLSGVLEISRLESGKVRVEEEECSLTEIARQVQTDFLPRAAAKNIAFSLDLSRLEHEIVNTDKLKLTQILVYLVDNAMKYTPKDGQVAISVVEEAAKEPQRSHAVYQFIVEDNGIGIGENLLEQIFEPFEREKNTTSSGIHGTGLGLAIAKDLAELIGGKMAVSSVVGEGSKFTLTLSLYMKADSADHANDGDMAEDGAMPKKILVVDDNEINLEIESEILMDEGFFVDTAEDGSIAFEKIKHAAPGDYDLILMDIQMPVMDGYHATRAIREIDNPALAEIPIIALSANTFEEDKQLAIESGMNAHLPKPLDMGRLYEMMRRFYKGSRALEKDRDPAC